MVSPPLGFFPWSYGALVFQSLDMSIFDVAFYPVSVKGHGDLLFLGPDTAILLYVFFLGPSIIVLLFRCPSIACPATSSSASDVTSSG
jgi:hypothetical protein